MTRPIMLVLAAHFHSQSLLFQFLSISSHCMRVWRILVVGLLVSMGQMRWFQARSDILSLNSNIRTIQLCRTLRWQTLKRMTMFHFTFSILPLSLDVKLTLSPLHFMMYQAYEPDTRYVMPLIPKIVDGETAQSTPYPSEVTSAHYCPLIHLVSVIHCSWFIFRNGNLWEPFVCKCFEPGRYISRLVFCCIQYHFSFLFYTDNYWDSSLVGLQLLVN